VGSAFLALAVMIQPKQLSYYLYFFFFSFLFDQIISGCIEKNDSKEICRTL